MLVTRLEFAVFSGNSGNKVDAQPMTGGSSNFVPIAVRIKISVAIIGFLSTRNRLELFLTTPDQ